jgi:hypothetical protein
MALDKKLQKSSGYGPSHLPHLFGELQTGDDACGPQWLPPPAEPIGA